jgi:hypothetical protein
MRRILLHHLTAIGVGAVALLATTARSQNLINDPGFELGFVPNCDQGVVPDTWYISTVTPDVYSFDCSVLKGLGPTSPFNNFPGLPSAHDGLRFVAGWANPSFIEAFGQTLAQPLTPGKTYCLSGYFTLSPAHPDAGFCRIYLSNSHAWSGATPVGTIGGPATLGAWAFDELVFTAPADAASLPNLIIVPASLNNSYIGTDTWALTLCIPSPTQKSSWGQLKSIYR